MNPIDACSKNDTKKYKTYFYAWTVKIKNSLDVGIADVIDLVAVCVIPKTKDTIYFIERNHDEIKHIHGIGYMGPKTSVSKILVKEISAANNQAYDDFSFNIKRCWDVNRWTRYIQKQGDSNGMYSIEKSTPKWWWRYFLNLPSKDDSSAATREKKRENAKEKIVFDTLECWFDDNKIFVDINSLMCYSATSASGVYKALMNPKNKQTMFIDLVKSIFSKFNIVSVLQRESIAKAISNELRGYTADDIAVYNFGKSISSVETGISDCMQKYCIEIQNNCVRFGDFAIKEPYDMLITDNKELEKLCTLHYIPEITLANREEYRIKIVDPDTFSDLNEEVIFIIRKAVDKSIVIDTEKLLSQ